ncbi:hypothetical protein HK097_010051 [Rhizophlyctis rosea]|uniref:Uncharacterized protein n=1 Tax=Rhizophlyctis rosea TaxID=64517 RepID=A0AAD5S817_9FUNG|nr:hypothetical protein HK097_010051 [Rhizophlyctis rosea]
MTDTPRSSTPTPPFSRVSLNSPHTSASLPDSRRTSSTTAPASARLFTSTSSPPSRSSTPSPPKSRASQVRYGGLRNGVDEEGDGKLDAGTGKTRKFKVVVKSGYEVLRGVVALGVLIGGLSILYTSPSTQSACWSAPTTPLTPFTAPLHLAKHYTQSFGKAIGWKELEHFGEEWYTKLVGQPQNAPAIPTLVDVHTTITEPTQEVKAPIGEATQRTEKGVLDLESEIAWERELERQEMTSAKRAQSSSSPRQPLPPYQQTNQPQPSIQQLKSNQPSLLTRFKALISTYISKPEPSIRVPRRALEMPLNPLICKTGVYAGHDSAYDDRCEAWCSAGACPKEVCRCVEGVEKVVVKGVEHGLGGGEGEKVDVDFTPRGSERVRRRYEGSGRLFVEGAGRDPAKPRFQVPKVVRGNKESTPVVNPVGPCPSARYAGHDPMYDERCRRWCGKKACPASLCRCVSGSEVGREGGKPFTHGHGQQREVDVDPKLHDLVWDSYVEEDRQKGAGERECVGGTWIGVSSVYDDRCQRGCGKGVGGGKCPKGLCLCNSDLRR